MSFYYSPKTINMHCYVIGLQDDFCVNQIIGSILHFKKVNFEKSLCKRFHIVILSINNRSYDDYKRLGESWRKHGSKKNKY